jgi:hypothetical protein
LGLDERHRGCGVETAINVSPNLIKAPQRTEGIAL